MAVFKKKFISYLGLFIWFLWSFGQPPSGASAANIIFIRTEGDFMGNKPVWIYIDGKRVCNVSANQHVSMKTSAGEHTFQVSFSGKPSLKTKEKESAISVSCSADQNAYFLVVSNPANRKAVSCAPIIGSSAEKLLLKSNKCDCIKK